MYVVESKVESMELGRFRVTLILDAKDFDSEETSALLPEGASGPIQSRAIPDDIVHELIQAGRPYSLTLSELHKRIDGNPATINRQAWTLATNQPDLQIRLRGWVWSPERGRYALTGAAMRYIETDPLPSA